MRSTRRSYELLNYVWLDNFQPYVLGADNLSYRFDSVEMAVAELQDDFDTWTREIESGERAPECGWSADEFFIRCVETGELIAIDIVGGRVCVMPPAAENLQRNDQK